MALSLSLRVWLVGCALELLELQKTVWRSSWRVFLFGFLDSPQILAGVGFWSFSNLALLSQNVSLGAEKAHRTSAHKTLSGHPRDRTVTGQKDLCLCTFFFAHFGSLSKRALRSVCLTAIPLRTAPHRQHL